MIVPVAAQAADEAQWIAEAERLVEAAASGTADARGFQREVHQSREALREIVRAGDGDHRELHQHMVLMVALLDAAAACHRGGRIVCPPDLMRQMRAQLVTLDSLAPPGA